MALHKGTSFRMINMKRVVFAAAEGGSYGQQDGGGNGTIYLINALVSAAAGGLFILAPEVVRHTYGLPTAWQFDVLRITTA